MHYEAKRREKKKKKTRLIDAAQRTQSRSVVDQLPDGSRRPRRVYVYLMMTSLTTRLSHSTLLAREWGRRGKQ